jgi:hypothetical protein
LYRSIPSLFQGIFFCPTFVYFALAGLMLLGIYYGTSKQWAC